MTQFTYTVKDELGIHARPAGLLVKKLAGYACDVKISNGTREVNAKGIMGLMGLGVKQGHEVTMTFDGADEAAACADVKAFFEENL